MGTVLIRVTLTCLWEMGGTLAETSGQLFLKVMNPGLEEKKTFATFLGKNFFFHEPWANGLAIHSWQKKVVSDPLPHFRANSFFIGQWPRHSRLAGKISIGPFATFSGKFFFHGPMAPPFTVGRKNKYRTLCHIFGQNNFFFMSHGRMAPPFTVGRKNKYRTLCHIFGQILFSWANGPAICGWQKKISSVPSATFSGKFFFHGPMAPPFTVGRKNKYRTLCHIFGQNNFFS
jgi:hypothetical protein